MLRYKTFLLAAILAAFVLLGFVTHSDAIKILEMRPEDGYSTETTVSGNYVYHQSYVKTDKPFYDVTWYVDDEPAGYTLWSDGRNATEALFLPYWLTGSHDGTTYTIKAYAWTVNNNNIPESDTKSYELTVYRPFQIEEMYPAYSSHYDYGGGAYNVPYVCTSDPYDRVEWFIGNKRHTSQGNGVKTSAAPTFYLTSDKVEGTSHTITAVAWYKADNGEMVSDTDSYTFRVYQPKVETKVHGGGGQQHLNVSGYVQLSRHYFDGWNIVMEGFVRAYNGSNDIITCRASFKHTWDKKRFDPQEHAAPTVNCGPGESYGPYYTDPMILNFHVGGPIGDKETYTLNAHIHLETGLDHRHVDSTNTFTAEHNQ